MGFPVRMQRLDDFTQDSSRPEGTRRAQDSKEPPRLPRFGAIVRRRWPILLALPLLALGVALVNYTTAPRTYTATGEATVTSLAPLPTQQQGYDNYYRALASEAASDDLVRVVQGSVFEANVAKRLRTRGIADPLPGEIGATRVFRILFVKVTTSDPNRSLVILQAAMDELTANGPQYLEGRPVQLATINLPTSATASSLKSGVTAAGMVFAGLLAAVAIVLAVELFDTRLHDRQETEDYLRLPVLGAIPRRRDAERAA